MAQDKVYEMTHEGVARLQTELERRKGQEREEIAERIKVALSFGDLSENSEYDDAKAEQGQNEARIGELEDILKYARVIDDEDISVSKVTLGAKITLEDVKSKERTEYTLVSEKEEDIFENRIASSSPVGAAIIGRKKSEVVTVSTPMGPLNYKIVKISRP